MRWLRRDLTSSFLNSLSTEGGKFCWNRRKKPHCHRLPEGGLWLPPPLGGTSRLRCGVAECLSGEAKGGRQKSFFMLSPQGDFKVREGRKREAGQ